MILYYKINDLDNLVTLNLKVERALATANSTACHKLSWGGVVDPRTQSTQSKERHHRKSTSQAIRTLSYNSLWQAERCLEHSGRSYNEFPSRRSIKNSSTVSVFHLSIAKVSTVFLPSVCRSMKGSEPLLYVTFSPGYLASLTLSLINAEMKVHEVDP